MPVNFDFEPTEWMAPVEAADLRVYMSLGVGDIALENFPKPWRKQKPFLSW